MAAYMQGGFAGQNGMPDFGAYGGQAQFGQDPYAGGAYGQTPSPYPQDGGFGANPYGGAGMSGYGQQSQHGKGGCSKGMQQQMGYGGMGGADRNGNGNGFGMNQGGYGGGYAGGYGNGDGGYGGDGEEWSRPEYSQGAGPEYQAESLFHVDPEEDSAEVEVHVFGPAGEQVPPAVTSFEAAGQIFSPEMIQQLRLAGFAKPTPIQAHTWAIGAAGRDVIGIAKTGSGKTLAFLMPGFLKILQARGRPPIMCVLAPTRELACQIEQEADKFGRSSGIRTACCYGGAPRGAQSGALRRGAQVVVACPGRLNDFIQSRVANMQNVTYLVLDEADRMLDMGFEPQIRSIIGATPPERQTLLFTATWPKEVRSLASEFLTRPIHVQTGSVDVLTVNKDITQHVMFVRDEAEKNQQMLSIFQTLSQGDRCLIFCEMKRSCEDLATSLMQTYGVPVVRIHGDMAQYERTGALEAFKNGRSPIMVATDVAARGIDVKGITVVINYDASGSSKDYVHRIGRTGRAGCKGTAYTFLLPREEKKAQDIVQVLQRSGAIIPPELEQFVQNRRRGGGKGGKGRGKGGGKGKGGSKGGGKGGGFGKGKPGPGLP